MKEKIEEIINKVKSDPTFLILFKANPVKAVESLLGVDLPDEQINNIIESVKSKIDLDDIGDTLKGFLGNKKESE